MALIFEWDENKAKSNQDKHGIAFDEASTVFGDPLSLTISDPAHSQAEHRFIIMELHIAESCWLSSTPKEATISALLVLGQRAGANEKPMKKKADKRQEEYDFSSGVRGKYAGRYAQGTNVVVLEPDVARVFPTPDAVNRSLRALAAIIRQSEKPVSAK
jgi:uncharacterized DUF497 family protein